jgi:putative nucleotidyltransferase with HDIG domain
MKLRQNKKARTKLQQQKDHAMNLLLLKIAIVVVATAIVVYFLPRMGEFNYSYELNQPWHYGTMISTQKFNIQMSDSTLGMKRDSLARSFVPYFTRNLQMEASVKDRLRRLNADERLTKHVITMIDSVFQQGVMLGTTYDSLQALGTNYIRVIRGNEAQIVPFDRVMSLQEAYQFIVGHNLSGFTNRDIRALNINTILAENLEYEPMKSEEELQAAYDAMNSSLGFVRVNEKIVDRGELVTEEIYQKLKSYEAVINHRAEENGRSGILLWGQIAIVALVFMLLVSYLSVFRADYIENPRSAILLFSIVVFFCIVSYVLVSRHLFHVFVIPCCMGSIIIRVFMDSRTAFISHIAMVLLISLSLNSPYEFLLFQILAGIVVILSLRELTQRSQIVQTAILITLTYYVFYTAYEFSIGAGISDLDRRIFMYFGINGLLLLFTYPFLWVMEKTFGFVSDVTLVELSNINHPLLQKMSEEAPGTFQHSMQVANLASEIAKKIGAKSQLVRTGALYHDIGKLERPAFFTENQAGGNPHKHLSAVKSAEVIISHVTTGLGLADRYNLPEQIKGFISTHHGLGKAKYFLITYKNEHPDEEVDENRFQYPGPNPRSKEEAILMMADSVEAASRSLTEYTEETISERVDTIVDTQVKEGYFEFCPITFKDIADAKEVMKEKLKIMYHTRISYPELNKNA